MSDVGGQERPFEAETWLLILKLIERQFQLAITNRNEVTGSEGHVFHIASGSKFFQMTFEATFEVKDLLSKRDMVVTEMATEAANDYIEGLRQAGAKPGDLLLVLAYPAQPPIRVIGPNIEGLCNVFSKVIVSLPIRLPKGLPENFAFKE